MVDFPASRVWWRHGGGDPMKFLNLMFGAGGAILASRCLKIHWAVAAYCGIVCVTWWLFHFGSQDPWVFCDFDGPFFPHGMSWHWFRNWVVGSASTSSGLFTFPPWGRKGITITPRVSPLFDAGCVLWGSKDKMSVGKLWTASDISGCKKVLNLFREMDILMCLGHLERHGTLRRFLAPFHGHFMRKNDDQRDLGVPYSQTTHLEKFCGSDQAWLTHVAHLGCIRFHVPKAKPPAPPALSKGDHPMIRVYVWVLLTTNNHYTMRAYYTSIYDIYLSIMNHLSFTQ